MLQQPALETLRLAGRRVAHDARQHPDDRVEQDLRRHLAARQHVIADRDFLEIAPSITRWSTPSNRPQTITAPGPSASSRTRACVSGFRAGSSTAAAAVAFGADRIDRRWPAHRRMSTMPAPPPAGVSSTLRCLSVA
jgi:hypothetical protein